MNDDKMTVDEVAEKSVQYCRKNNTNDQYTVEPQLSRLFDYPDLLLWSRFFMNINKM